MKRTNLFTPTLKEKPSDIEQKGQVLLFRAGFLKKVSNGLFVYLPLMQRVMDKVKNIIKRKMSEANSSEVKFPILVSKDALDLSNRWNAFGKEMFRLKDRHGIDFAISPTSEEAACIVAGSFIKSYKNMPFSIYQIQSKHRDEISPRNGVMRAREFTMKDAYSFHTSEECLDNYYNRMRKAYVELFNELNLEVVAVSADTGAMGGSGSEEIMALFEGAESEICVCPKCDFAANAEAVSVEEGRGETFLKKSPSSPLKVATPRVKTIDELVDFFKTTKQSFAKSVLFVADKKLVCAVVRGDREVNDLKLKKVLQASELEIASAERVIKSKKTVPGFVGPIALKGIKIVVDNEVLNMKNFITGANEKDFHYTNCNVADFSKFEASDIRFAAEGDTCPKCKTAILDFKKGSELGHIFKLGKRYTDKMDIKYTNQDGKLATPTMGCYGIGIERTIASIVEQHSDEKGIVWPKNIAPFAVNLITVDMQNEAQAKASREIYDTLIKNNIEVIWDDTEARPGSKFMDCELIGYPIRIVVGRGIVDGKVEVVIRKTGEKQEVFVNKLLTIL